MTKLGKGESVRWRRAGAIEWEHGHTLCAENGGMVEVRRNDGSEWALWTSVATVERVPE